MKIEFKKIKEADEKGCGKFKHLWNGWCGKTYRNPFKKELGFEICKECKAKLQRTKQIEKELNKVIDKVLDLDKFSGVKYMLKKELSEITLEAKE